MTTVHGSPSNLGACEACGKTPTERASSSHDDYGGIDPCLGGLIPGVSHACCGHGGRSMPYVTLGGEPGQDYESIKNRVTLYGMHATQFFNLIRAAKLNDGVLW